MPPSKPYVLPAILVPFGKDCIQRPAPSDSVASYGHRRCPSHFFMLLQLCDDAQILKRGYVPLHIPAAG